MGFLTFLVISIAIVVGDVYFTIKEYEKKLTEGKGDKV